MLPRSKLLILWLIIFLFSPAIVRGERITRTVLENGLVLIVSEDHSVPAVSLTAYVRLGSRHEDRETNGYAHFLEHLIVRKRIDGRPAGNRRKIFNLGGSEKASTSLDRTRYGILVASKDFDSALEIMNDALMKGEFSSKDIEDEKEIVGNELKKLRQDISYSSFRELAKVLFRGSSYEYAPIGRSEVIENASREKLNQFYKAFYVPNNLVLVIAGDVQTEEAINKVKQTFKVYTPNSILPQKPAILRGFPGYANLTKKVNFKGQGSCNFGFLIPGFRHPDVYALQVVSRILGSGLSGRLDLRLVEKEQLASNIKSWFSIYEDQGIMVFSILPRDVKHVYKLGELALDEISKLKENGLTNEELRKAKKQIHRRYTLENEGLEDRAETLATAAAFGGLKYHDSYLPNVDKVSLSDVKKALDLYLCKENLKILYLVAEGMEAISGEQAKEIDRLADTIKIGSLTPAGLDFKKELYPSAEAHRFDSRDSRGSDHSQDRVTREKLSNGLTLLFIQRDDLPIASVSLQIKAGSKYGKKAGLAKAVSMWLMEGTRRFKKNHILEKMDELGGRLQVDTTKERVILKSTYLSSDLEEGLELMASMIKEPLLNEDGLLNVRSLLVSEVKRKQDELPAVATNLLFQTVFQSHANAQPIEGTLRSLKEITREDVVNFYKEYFTADRSVLTIVGSADLRQVRNWCDKYFSPWKNKGGTEIRKEDSFVAFKGGTVTRETDKDQARIILGVPLSCALDKEYAKISLFSVILGVRNFFDLDYNESISYESGVQLELLSDTPLLYGYASTSKHNSEKARAIIQRNLIGLVNGNLSQEELSLSKKRIIGLYSLANIKPSSLASLAGFFDLLGKPDYYPEKFFMEMNAIDAKSLAQFARKYINMDKLTTVIVGPTKQN